jgi:hypothetical protein
MLAGLDSGYDNMFKVSLVGNFLFGGAGSVGGIGGVIILRKTTKSKQIGSLPAVLKTAKLMYPESALMSR